MKFLTLLLIGALAYAAKASEPELRRYLKIKAM
jgi:hypothetical protein